MGSLRRPSNQQNYENLLELRPDTPDINDPLTPESDLPLTPESSNPVLNMSENPDLQTLLAVESENEATTSAAPDYAGSTMTQPLHPEQTTEPPGSVEQAEGDDTNHIAKEVIDNLIAENIFEEPEAKRLRIDPEFNASALAEETELATQNLEQLIQMEQAEPTEMEHTHSEQAVTEHGELPVQTEQVANPEPREPAEHSEEGRTSAQPLPDDDALFVRQLEVVLEENKRSKAFTQFSKSDIVDEAQPETESTKHEERAENISKEQSSEDTSDIKESEPKEYLKETLKDGDTKETEEPKVDEEFNPKSSLEQTEELKSEDSDSKSDKTKEKKRKRGKSESQKDDQASKKQKTDSDEEQKHVDKKEDTEQILKGPSETSDEKTVGKDETVKTPSDEEQEKAEEKGKEEKRKEKGEVGKRKEDSKKRDEKEKGKEKKRPDKKYSKKKQDKEKRGEKREQEHTSSDEKNDEKGKESKQEGDSPTVEDNSKTRSKSKKETAKSEEAVPEAEVPRADVHERGGTSREDQDEGLGGDSDGVSSAGSESTGYSLRARPPTPAPTRTRRTLLPKYPARSSQRRKDHF